MKEYGPNDGPLGKAPDVSIGASDTVLLAVSAVGFCMLAWSVYSIVLAKLKTARELEQEAEKKEISYGESLARADVSTLNRAQRRARAKHIMKQKRKLGGRAGADGENNNNNNNNNELLLLQDEHAQPHEENIPAWDSNHLHANGQQNLLSRKERQKAAKQVELQERKLLEKDRRNEQKMAQEVAVARRKQKEAQQKQKAETEKRKRLEQKQTDELAMYRAWKIFLEAKNNNPDDSITVQEWIRELKEHRIVYLHELADRFELEESTIYKRIQELLDENRLCGILEKSHCGNEGSESRLRFVYLSPEDMSELASFVTHQERFSSRDFARHVTEQLPEFSLPSSVE